MVAVCWTRLRHTTVIKALKFVQFTSTNMLAITTLVVSTNMVLVVTVRGCASFIMQQ